MCVLHLLANRVSWLCLSTFLLAIHLDLWDLMLLPFPVGFNSLNYWLRPTHSWYVRMCGRMCLLHMRNLCVRVIAVFPESDIHDLTWREASIPWYYLHSTRPLLPSSESYRHKRTDAICLLLLLHLGVRTCMCMFMGVCVSACVSTGFNLEEAE